MVSIITPLYNRYDLVQETWNSIKNQTHPNWEWIVVDDGSTDTGPDYIRSLQRTDSRVKFHPSLKGNLGPSACRNKGANLALGDYLLFLDSDDIISDSCLENRQSFLKNRPNLDFAVFSQEVFKNIPGDTGELFNLYFSSKQEYLEAFLSDTPAWQTSGPLWKKESFLSIGGFLEAYRIMEDPELHIRAIVEGLQFEVVKATPDFFYRLLPKTKQQEDKFYKDSILGRLVFFKDMYAYLIKKTVVKENKDALSIGFIFFIKNFLWSRTKEFKNEFLIAINWGKANDLISGRQYYQLRLYQKINNNVVLNKIPVIKGLMYSFL